MSRDVRKALMIAKADGGYLPPGHPEREANLAKFMEGAHPAVLNEDGTPKTLYHGTSDNIHEFNLEHPNRKDAGWLGHGVYLWDKPNIAGDYAQYLKPGAASPNILPLHAALKKPYFATAKDKQKFMLLQHSQGRDVASDASKAWTDDLKNKGHDGVILTGAGVNWKDAPNEYVIFDPRQIKSATGNRGTFNPSEPDITKADGGYIHDPARHIRKALMIAKADGGDVGNSPKSLGFSGPWYHGSSRIDRVVDKNEINPRRATSGPMPFFTDDPKIASNYAKCKADTSLRAQDTGKVENYFTVHPEHIGISGRSQIPVERSWYFLPQEKRQEIANKALKIGYEKPEEASGDIILHPTEKNSSIASEDHYNWLLKNNRGNHLASLRELWHDSGQLFGNEEQLEKIYHLAGYNYPISQENAPWTEASGVLPAMIRMNSPLDTSNQKELLEKVVPHLENVFKRDRSRTAEQGTDQWDKNERFTPKEWTAQLKEDAQNGKNSFVFTSIPDKITKALKGLGYDGILDTGGKMGGEGHTVAIPFEPHQVRSIFAKFDPAKQNSKKLTAATGGYIGHHHDQSVDRALELAYKHAYQSGATLPAAVDLARQLKPGRR
jgi:hypothetical protein